MEVRSRSANPTDSPVKARTEPHVIIIRKETSLPYDINQEKKVGGSSVLALQLLR
jgi:hypothetical protein